MEDRWRLNALCAETDPEAFFPERGGSSRAAKAVCGRCPVTADCLAAALANDERYGVWGGMSERRRRRLSKGSLKAVAP
jgi:WhiB family redox-sensing transcriptional regulator